MRPPLKSEKPSEPPTVQFWLYWLSEGSTLFGKNNRWYADVSEKDGNRSARADLSWPSCARTASSLSRTGARREVAVSLAGLPAGASVTPAVAAAIVLVIAAGSSMGVMSWTGASSGRFRSCLRRR